MRLPWYGSLVAGMLGMGIFFAGLHLYQDHTILHQLLQNEIVRIQAAQKAAP
jgi:hypothetical protein